MLAAGILGFVMRMKCLDSWAGITSYIKEENNLPVCTLLENPVTGWPYWNDIREFSKKTGISIKSICVDLDFSVFDE